VEGDGSAVAFLIPTTRPASRDIVVLSPSYDHNDDRFLPKSHRNNGLRGGRSTTTWLSGFS